MWDDGTLKLATHFAINVIVSSMSCHVLCMANLRLPSEVLSPKGMVNNGDLTWQQL